MDRSHDTIESYLSLQSLSKGYQGQTVVDRVQLDLEQGQFLSLLGPSGSGKTTILRMIAGLTPPDQGEIWLKGQAISALPPYKRQMGMVFQQYALFPHLTVEQNVAYGLKARKMKRSEINKRVTQYLQLVDLTGLEKRKPRELSGGQQQRVSLARALAVEPAVMLFDEPLSNLDVRLKEQMLTEIRALHRSLGFTAIYVTHDQNEALYLSDRIAVLNQGKIEQFGTPETILRSPASPFVADFFGYTNRISGVTLEDDHQAKAGNRHIPVGHQQGEPGDQGELWIRPQALQWVDEGEATDHRRMEAEIKDCRYLGGDTEAILQLSHEVDQSVVAKFPQMIHPLPQPGDTVCVQIHPDGVCFFKENKKP